MSKPIALLFNDIHVSKDNISEFHKNWQEAVSICLDRGITKIFVGGDLWQARSAQTLDTLMAVREELMSTVLQNITVCLAPGNHDKVNQESILSYSHLFSEYPGVNVINETYSEVLSDDIVLHVISYFPEAGSFSEKLNSIIIDGSRKNILYCHQGIRGGLTKESATELPAKLFDRFDATLVGHYHDRKKVLDHNIWYIGSSRQHNFGEDVDKGYTLLYDDGTVEFVQNQANIQYSVMNIDIKALTPKKIKEIQRIKDSTNTKIKIKVYCKSTETSTVNRQELINAGVSKVEFVTEQTQVVSTATYDISQRFSKDTLKKKYQEFCSQYDILDSELGLSYLEKINFNINV